MIGRLRGTLIDKQPPWVVVDVSGVGYEIELPMSSIYQLPASGETVVLRIHQGLRDEVPVLYGFYTEGERGLFRALIRVNGVGPKMALAILSGISAEEFRRSVEQKDTATLTRLPGIGKKIAERLTLEMQDRLDGLGSAAGGLPGAIAGAGTAPSADDPRAEASAALVALGYKPAEAQRLLQGIEAEDSEQLIRAALKKAVR
ncbi:Holliday junction branch migration protein RuvA [Spiribacter aquaticus]|jgi:Holliday junction DNA helicase RuvA|uniref:Holliday junction branch migration complex subunit RuvA n=1 Tax=Spiribacter aquaticus TaxID=1935996 RepID=A0A557RKI8_9GAMM|nr:MULTISPECIES: Holliday junction branch migration protein RuvA [Spiribacter]KAF0279831.1 Holliday junction DNA helicase RuvA [Spiribacter roseus]TVO65645.1 Holliday junction branch migration protein RuvA [Spiribacter aquaticus]